MSKYFIIVAIFLSIFVRPISIFADEPVGDSSQNNTSKSDYTLPYSGILPDHPLYFLKATRDRVIAFFLSHPVKKADYDLLQSDKRVEASYRLSQKGKSELSESTFSKAENYFEDAISRTHDAKTQGINVKDFSKKLYEADEKYVQVLDDMKNSFGNKEKAKWGKDRKRLDELEKRVKELSK